jgi:phosphatidylglycerophosphate synthase
VSTVRRGPVAGLILQIALLAALATRVELGVAGWLAGAAYGVTVCALLDHGLRRAGRDRLGPADWVTLSRAVLTGGVTALAVAAFVHPVPVAPMVALAAVALVLDGVDGQVARRTHTCSALGARFDMEVDAFLILVLSAYDVPRFGVWVLAIGAMRYAFVAASWPLPWMRQGLPPRYWRKVVAATQGVVLALAASDLLPRPLATAPIVVGLALLVESFGRDVAFLIQHRHAVPAELSTVVSEAGASALSR